MSDPLNSEILDVLSSIRRLVSEERKGDNVARAFPRPAEAPPEAEAGRESALPKESRFVLTQALRVGDSAPDEAEDERNKTLAAEVESWARDAAEQGEDRASPGKADAAETEPSLESTIAELEAAVAGIEAEFEPDGGDAEESAGDAIPERVWAEAPASPRPASGFSGIIAGYEALSMTEERLDAPITGEVMYTEPAQPFSTSWLRPRSVAAPVADASGDDPDGEGATDDSLMAMPSATEDPAPEPDEMLLDTGETVLEGDGADDLAGEDETTSESEESLAAAPATAAAAVVAGRLHLEADEQRMRPRIVRADQGGDSGADLDLEADAEPDGSHADDGEDDLLDPLAGDAIDIAMLRDMVVEIIREELRGTLGERITRNVRGLVRREIARMLAEERRDEG